MSDNFCWSCLKEKDNVTKTKGEYHSGICPDCIDEQEAQLKKINAELIQKDRAPHYSSWHEQDVVIRDVSIKVNGETYFIQGFCTCEAAYDTCKAFNMVKQFIDTGLKYFIHYGNFDLLKQYDFWFDIQKVGQFYEFGGNCIKYSNAFNLRTLDINQIWEYIEVWTRIPDRLKLRIKKQVNKKLVFASAPEPHSADKRFCFKDFKDYKETGKPEITMIPELNPPEQSKKEAAP